MATQGVGAVVGVQVQDGADSDMGVNLCVLDVAARTRLDGDASVDGYLSVAVVRRLVVVAGQERCPAAEVDGHYRLARRAASNPRQERTREVRRGGRLHEAQDTRFRVPLQDTVYAGSRTAGAAVRPGRRNRSGYAASISLKAKPTVIDERLMPLKAIHHLRQRCIRGV